MSAPNVELARATYNAFSRQDWDTYLSLMDEDVTIESMIAALEGGYHGHDGVRRWWDDFLGAFPDYTMEIEQVRAVGDGTVACLHGSARSAAVDAPISDPFWHVMTWRDGRCTWWRACGSEAEALEALGRG